MDRMTPETNMPREKYEITTFCEFGWYQWVYFRDTYVTFTGYKFVFWSYFGPSIDVGPALTAKILRNNGQQVHRYTYRALTPDELVNPDEIKACDKFETAIDEKLGPEAPAKYFESDPYIVTQTLDQYEDDEEHQTHMP